MPPAFPAPGSVHPSAKRRKVGVVDDTTYIARGAGGNAPVTGSSRMSRANNASVAHDAGRGAFRPKDDNGPIVSLPLFGFAMYALLS